jgi:hypothetical protein
LSPDGREETVKKPRWLRLRRGGADDGSSVSKSESLKKVRQQTDQLLKQQDAQKKRDAEEKARKSS